MNEFLKLALPALVTIIGNVVFYLIIKGKVDKSIESYKISYSGVFKEKIDIYKEILTQAYDLKIKIRQFQYFGKAEFGEQIKVDFNKFIRFYIINKPFLSETIIDNLKRLVSELQECFEDFYKQNTLQDKAGLPSDVRRELLQKFFDSGNKFKKDNPFEELENNIIKEMKQDLMLIK